MYTSLIATFGVFAAGFLMRPIGAIIFGHIGDKYGRKTALSASIILMSFPTSLIGLIPAYSEIGIFAPLALVLIRLMQGLSIGGETSGFMVYLIESMPQSKRKALLGSIALSSTALGLFFGFLASFICNFYFSEIEWAWRIPFLISFPIGIVGFYIRRKLEESHEFQELKNRNLMAQSPLKELIKEHKARFFILCGLFVSISIPFYIFFGFMATFLVKILHYTSREVSIIYLVCSFVFICSSLLSGVLSDRFGIYKILLTSIVIFAITLFPSFFLILKGDFILTLIGCLLFIVTISLYQGSIPSTIMRFFPTRVRATGTALSFNMISILFGGFTPILLVWLLRVTGNQLVILAYVILSSLITIASLVIARRHKII